MLNSLRLRLWPLVIGLTSCLVLTGCPLKKFPQYTGVFERVGEPVTSLWYGGYSPDDILGDYQLPKKWEVTDGVYFQGSTYFHQLRFDPVANDEDFPRPDAEASFSALVTDLTRKFQGSMENPHLNGVIVYKETGPRPGNGPGCWLDYEWSIYIDPGKMKPRMDALLAAYQADPQIQTGKGSSQPVLIPEEQRREPPIYAKALAQWEKDLQAEKGMTFEIEFRLGIIGNSGCSPVNGDPAPTMNRPVGTITATYHAPMSSYSDSFNPVMADSSVLAAGTDHGYSLFSQLIQKPWLQGMSQ